LFTFVFRLTETKAYDKSESFVLKSLAQETFARKLAKVLRDTLAS